jgi:IS30 family transposase
MTDRSPAAAAERRAHIVELHNLNVSTAEIATRMGITPRSVMRARAAAGLTKPQPTPFTIEEYYAAQEMLDDGASYHEVARTLGRWPGTIKKRLPGYTLDKYQVSQAAAMGRAMAAIERATSLTAQRKGGAI